MYLEWNDMLKYYGGQLNQHNNDFNEFYISDYSAAGRKTHAMLIFKNSTGVVSPFESQEEPKLDTQESNKTHAENLLLHAKAWTDLLPEAIKQSNAQSVVVSLVLNRTTCKSCSDLLISKRKAVLNGLPKSQADKCKFIVASSGLYSKTSADELQALKTNGWIVAALKINGATAPRFQTLMNLLTKELNQEDRALDLNGI